MTEVTKPSSDAIGKIEVFIEHYYNLDYEISRDAFSVPCHIDGKPISLGNLLTASLNDYLIAKANKNVENLRYAVTNLLLAITQLFGAKLVTESKSLLSKFNECGEQNKQLKELGDQLRAEIASLRMENKRLHNLVGDDNGDNTSTLEPNE